MLRLRDGEDENEVCHTVLVPALIVEGAFPQPGVTAKEEPNRAEITNKFENIPFILSRKFWL